MVKSRRKNGPHLSDDLVSSRSGHPGDQDIFEGVLKVGDVLFHFGKIVDECLGGGPPGRPSESHVLRRETRNSSKDTNHTNGQGETETCFRTLTVFHVSAAPPRTASPTATSVHHPSTSGTTMSTVDRANWPRSNVSRLAMKTDSSQSR
jgi:hypothetical protein